MLEHFEEITALYDGQSHLKPNELSPLIGGWVIPEDMRVDDGILFWRWGNFGDPITPDQRTMRMEILDKFLCINDAEDEVILNYAQRWGVLGLCEHGFPFGHELFSEEKIEGFKYGGRIGVCVPKPVQHYNPESLERWRHYSRQMRAIVALATTLRNLKPENIRLPKKFDPKGFRVEKIARDDGSFRSTVHIPSYLPGKPEDWTTLFQDGGSFITGVYDPVKMGQSLLSLVIGEWLYKSDVRPHFLWFGDKSSFELRSDAFAHGLFSILTIQLMLLINGSPDYALCSGCSQPLLLRKGQSRARKSFCKDCGLKASRKESVKRYLQQERENPNREKRKRLTGKQVQAIHRALQKPKPRLVEELAEKYNVSKWAIYKIREGKTHSKQ